MKTTNKTRRKEMGTVKNRRGINKVSQKIDKKIKIKIISEILKSAIDTKQVSYSETRSCKNQICSLRTILEHTQKEQEK